MLSKFFTREEVECGCKACGTVPGNKIMEVADKIREGWGGPIKVTSGARCLEYNNYLRMHGVKAAHRSAHIDGIAIDLRPVNGDITGFHAYILSRLDELGLRMESPKHTKTWCHIDLRPVAPGKSRVFLP